jgi:hypothetical protein
MSDIILKKKLRQSSCKIPVFLFGLNETSIFWTDFRKILEYQRGRESVVGLAAG